MNNDVLFPGSKLSFIGTKACESYIRLNNSLQIGINPEICTVRRADLANILQLVDDLNVVEARAIISNDVLAREFDSSSIMHAVNDNLKNKFYDFMYKNRMITLSVNNNDLIDGREFKAHICLVKPKNE